ncbi:Protein of unknown function [Bacillus cereus]|nr:Protein of unknown function [Bacillus cereus]
MKIELNWLAIAVRL